jgi:KipI family sensor histidine kinase inhibitor
MLYDKPISRLMGDRAVVFELGDEISPVVNQKVRELFVGFDRAAIKGIVELVPGYRSLLVIYNPLKNNPQELESLAGAILNDEGASQLPAPKTVEIPVVYGEEYGPDLKWVARYHKISPQAVIRLHTQPVYQVYMIGFTPGYPYLGELPDALSTPRRKTPRILVPRGSVGIAQKQTGIYPVASPGGWQIIGRTPVGLFDPLNQPPALLSMGDFVRFFPISKDEMITWQQRHA